MIGRGDRGMRVVPRRGRPAPSGGARRVHRLPSAARLRSEPRRVRGLPRRQDHTGRERGVRPPRLRQLPHAARAGRRPQRLRGMPPGRPGDSRERGSVHQLPRAPRRRSRLRRHHLHDLPLEGRRVRPERARRRHRLRVVSQAAWLLRTRREGRVPELPPSRGHAGRLEPGPRRVHVLPRRVRGTRAGESRRLRHLPCRRAEVGARRSSSLRRLPRAARRATNAGVRHLPREQGQRTTRVDRGRLRDLPPPARPARPPRTTRLPDLPRSGHLACASRGRGTRGVRELPRVPSRAAPRRPCGVHGDLPREQARSPARRPGLRRVPRVSTLTVAR